LYFEEEFGYRRINKLIPVAATTVKNWCITFAEAKDIKMGNKIHTQMIQVRVKDTKNNWYSR